jgi:hypothetical protein
VAGQSDGTSAGGKAGGKRGATSKPVIIDLDADAVSSSTATAPGTSVPATPAATAKSSAKMPSDPPAKPAQKAASSTAGVAKPDALKPSGPKSDALKSDAPESDAPKSGTPKSSPQKTETVSKPDTVSDAGADATGTVVPPRDRAASGASSSSGGPSAFYLFAAGLIGGLLALVLMFLATLAGLFSLPDGRVDDQATALAALQSRVASVEQQAGETDNLSDQPALLAPLEEGLASLRAQLNDLEASLPDANLPVDGDAGPGPDVSQLLNDALTPVDSRISSIEASLQSALDALESAEPGTVVAPDPALAGRLEAVSEQVAALQAAQSEDPAELTAESAARFEALEGLVSATSAEISAMAEALETLEATLQASMASLEERLTGLDGQDAQLGTRLDAMDASVTALANAPVAQAPDRLARLGVALDALAAARDAGEDVGPSLQAAEAVSSFDGDLLQALAPARGGAVGGDLSQTGLIAAYDGAYAAMRAAIPAQEGAGLFGALEDRARQLVTIRAPQGAVLGEGASAFDQLDQMGQRLATRDYAGALALAQALPEAVQTAGGQLIDQLAARLALDEAIGATRQALLAQLAASTTSPSTTSP